MSIEMVRIALSPRFALNELHSFLVPSRVSTINLSCVCLFPDFPCQRIVCDDIDDVDLGFSARSLQFVSNAHLQDYVDASGESGYRPAEAFHPTSILLCRQRPPTMEAASLQPLAQVPCAELSPSVDLWMSSVSALHGVLDVFVLGSCSFHSNCP